ncbi:hypothetical protein RYX36_032244 [Vicia faba]
MKHVSIEVPLVVLQIDEDDKKIRESSSLRNPDESIQLLLLLIQRMWRLRNKLRFRVYNWSMSEASNIGGLLKRTEKFEVVKEY